jgi:DNA repair protein RecO (recombination protein O)
LKVSEQGFLISRINYSESSSIVRCFTREQGLKAFLFQGAKKKKGYVLMPMAPLEFTCYQRNDSKLAKMTEAQLFISFTEIPFHPIKSGLVFFMAEVLQNVLHEDVKDNHLFEFIEQEMQWLDHSSTITNYPIYWMFEISKHLGFFPLFSDGKYFDLEEGIFAESKPINHRYLSGEIVSFLSDLVQMQKNEMMAYSLNKNERKLVLNFLFDYYTFHLPNFKKIKTIEIIEESWS